MTKEIYGIGRAAHFLECDKRTFKAWLDKEKKAGNDEFNPTYKNGKEPFWTKEQLKALKRRHL